MNQRTLPALFEESVRCFGANPFLLEKREGAYRSSTYREVHAEVRYFAAGLLRLGLKPGERVALISEGRNQWVIAELAIFYCGAISVPLSNKLQEASDLAFRLQHSGCRMVIVSALQAPKLRRLQPQLPFLEKIIVLDSPVNNFDTEISAQDLTERGRQFLQDEPDIVESRLTLFGENDPACICYTSGTTDDPKGIVLTHRNMTANVEQCSQLLEIEESYCSLLILPWDHSFTHTAGIYLIAQNGASLAAVEAGKTPAEALRNLPKNILEVRPSFLFSVPALAQNFRNNIERGIRAKGKLVESLFSWGLQIGYIYNREGYNRGQGWRVFLKPLQLLFDRLIFSKVRQGFGGKLLFFIGGGALLDLELQRFFYATGIPMLQGYGLTEAAPVISANVPKRHKLGSSGSLVSALEVRICDEGGRELPMGQEGEIVVRGENVMGGYWNNEKATREALRGGWLYTGDRGRLDADGFLYVLGRTKSLLINHNGEKYCPEGIEQALASQSPFIDQVMLYNDHSAYTVALVVPHRGQLLSWLEENRLSGSTEEGQKAALRCIQAEIHSFRKGGKHAGAFPAEWLPAAVAVLDEAFSEQNRMLNSTLKMVRGCILERYRQRIEVLFTPEGRNILHTRNLDSIASLFRP